MTELWLFLLVWGVWLLMPIIIDGNQILYKLLVIFISQWRQRNVPKIKHRNKTLPKVSVVIPAHNEKEVIEKCLNSLKLQDYPHKKIEVIIVDDGSTDTTKDLVKNHIHGLNGNGYINGKKANGNGKTNGKGKNGGNNHINNHVKVNGKKYETNGFDGVMKLYTNGHKGKAYALNLGIKKAKGDLIINVDADIVLAPKAISKMVEAFLERKDLGAACGNVEIDWKSLENLSSINMFLAKCQFLEFLNAFQIGKRYQALTNSMYTLAGAFSAFRRKTLLNTPLYQEDTVSEDTDLTFEIRKQKGTKIGYVPQATAYLHPSLTFDEIYAQRLRWHRGELEVCAKHLDMVGNKKYGFFGKFGLRETLITDHTLAFTRMVWVLLLPFFVFFGYSSSIIFGAVVFTYLFYVALDFLITFICYRLADEASKKRIEEAFAHCFALPFFRFFCFYPRMAGYLLPFKEEAVWKVNGPINGLKNGFNGVKNGVGNGVKNGYNGVKNGLGATFMHSRNRNNSFVEEAKYKK